MIYAVEIIVLDQPSISPKPQGVPTQHLPIMYDTIEDALEAGRDFIARSGAPPGTMVFQIVDQGGDIVVAPSAGS